MFNITVMSTFSTHRCLLLIAFPKNNIKVRRLDIVDITCNAM